MAGLLLMIINRRKVLHITIKSYRDAINRIMVINKI